MSALSIGRSSSCDIVVADPTVSRRHAELTEISPDTYRFVDVGSTSGSFQHRDGVWRPIMDAELQAADRLRLGEYETTIAELLDVLPAEPQETQSSLQDSRPPDASPPEVPPPSLPVIERDPETGRIVVRTR